MPAPWLPPLVHEIGRRSFAFYPSIANAEPNEWLIRGASWTVVEVVNARTGLEIADALHRRYPERFEVTKLMDLLASQTTLDALIAYQAPASIIASWDSELAQFRALRAKYLIYD